MAWAAGVNPLLMVRLPGLAEVLGALGLVLPALTPIQPRLTVLAALGLAVVMVLAAIFHITHGEIVPDVIVNIVLLALCLFVVYGRTNRAPIGPR